MPGLKLSIAAASIYTNPFKWTRTITTTTTTTTTIATTSTTKSTVPFSTPISLSISNNNKGRKITRYAPLASAVHVTLPSCINSSHNKGLGSSICRQNCFSSSSSSSIPDKGGVCGSSGAGIVTDMGKRNGDKPNRDGCYQDDHFSPQHQQQPLPSQLQQHQPSKFLTLPTVLTLGRVAAVPLLIATFYIDCWWGRTATTSIFVAAAITDWLDGYIARKMRLGSAFGAFLDPVADKLMVAATLVLLCTKPLEVAMIGQVPWLLTVPSIAIIGREITMSAVREWAASQNSKLLEAVAVNNLGKWKTATQMSALTIILATRDSSLGVLAASGVVLLYISAGLSLWSLAVYMSKIGKVLLK